MSSTSRLAHDEIRRRAEALGEWFHNIDLDGVKTAPNHFLHDYPASKWRRFAHVVEDVGDDLLHDDLELVVSADLAHLQAFHARMSSDPGVQAALGAEGLI